MLTGKDIGYLIRQPEMISPEQLPNISELSEKYPYSQLFSVLYIKGMHSSNSLDFETALKKHSFRISDRARLYQLIHEKTQISDLSGESGELQSDTASFHDQSQLKNTESEPIEEEIELNTEEPLETDVEAQENGSEVEIVTSESEEAVDGYTEESDLLPIDLPEDPLEENILHHAVAQHYHLDALSPEEEAAMEKKKKEVASDSQKVNITTTKDSHVSGTHDIQSDGKLSFTGWLRSNEHYEEREDEQSLIKAVVEEFSEFDPMASLYGEVEKPKKEFFSPTKKAKESLQEDRLPVSETLAKIYVMQGNYPKAIEAYNELILAFPEKKIFFANQIEDLKKKLNT